MVRWILARRDSWGVCDICHTEPNVFRVDLRFALERAQALLSSPGSIRGGQGRPWASQSRSLRASCRPLRVHRHIGYVPRGTSDMKYLSANFRSPKCLSANILSAFRQISEVRSASRQISDVSMDSKRSATRAETSQIDSAMNRDVPGHPHAPPMDDRSAWRHSYVKFNPTQQRSEVPLHM